MASATALHIKILFHCPKKSAELVIGQKRPKGTTHAVATITLSRFRQLALKHSQIIDHKKIVPVISPISPVSPAIWI